MCGASAAALRFSWVKHHCVSRTKKPSAIRSNIVLLVQLGLSILKGIHLTSTSRVRLYYLPLVSVLGEPILRCKCIFERVPPGRDVLAKKHHRNAVHVWCLNTGELGVHEVDSACAILSPEEKIRQWQHHFPEDRRDFASAHALLRQSLSLYSDINPEDWRFKVAANGKPFILRTGNQRQKPFSFSLSHTRGLVACAIGTQLGIGIDVESIDRTVDIDSIAPLCLSSSELDNLMRCPAPEQQIRFIELWVLKEALVKARGTGLSGLKGSSFSLREDGGIELVSRLIDQAEWHFELFRPTPRYRLGVAVKCSSAKVSVRWTKIGR